ncbi:MAG TPA: hypothetical protein VEA38_04760 [Terriglobales bacterium]|nr:hypothetical protein [Terriglobales bacterium]
MKGLERFSLVGRVVLVTGATRGLGLEIACGFAGAGAAVRDRRPLQDITADDFRRLIETNLVAQYALASSMVGPQSFNGDPAYVASKGGSRR